MRKCHTLVHTLLLVTSPALFAHPQYEQPIVQQVHSQEISYGDFTFTYDEILRLLDDIESGKIEQYSEEQLDRINQFIVFLAERGTLPGEYAANVGLHNDIVALYTDAYFSSDADESYLNGTENATIMLCKHHKHKHHKDKHKHKHGHKKKFIAKVKNFVSKHKKAILIGAAIIIGATVAIIAVAAINSTTAVAAASAAAAANNHHASRRPSDAPELEGAVENQITSFKEKLVTEELLNADLPIEENMRALGSLFSHQSVQGLQQQLASSPQLYQEVESMRWYNNGLSPQIGHYSIDQTFSTNYASLYSAPQMDFNILAYQARGENAFSNGYYEQAVHDFGKAIDLNPANPFTYLERGAAHFSLGQYDHSLNDYQQYIAQKPMSIEPFLLSSFTQGFAKRLPDGIYDSGKGTFLFLADLVKHPIHTSEQVWDSLVVLKDLVKTQAWGTIAETLSPQVHDLIVNWDSLSSYERGELAGYAFGRYGTDFLLYNAAAKTCQELVAIAKNLQLARKTLLLETAGSIPDGAKIIEANQETISLAKNIGLSTSTTSQLKRAGNLETSLSTTVEQFTAEMQQSYQLFKQAEAILEHYRKAYITEGTARELIQQTGIRTFPRPAGIPENYRIKITNSGAGMKYVHPNNTGIYVRVMPGKPHSVFPHQQKP